MRLNQKARMNRLFGGGRCLDVAIDHGVCNEPISFPVSRTWKASSPSLSRLGPTRSR